MIHPSYNELLKTLNEVRDENEPEIDSRYSLVIASAKRARQIVYGQEPLADHVSTYKPLSIAVEEIREGKVHITKEGEGWLHTSSQYGKPTFFHRYRNFGDRRC